MKTLIITILLLTLSACSATTTNYKTKRMSTIYSASENSTIYIDGIRRDNLILSKNLFRY